MIPYRYMIIKATFTPNSDHLNHFSAQLHSITQSWPQNRRGQQNQVPIPNPKYTEPFKQAIPNMVSGIRSPRQAVIQLMNFALIVSSAFMVPSRVSSSANFFVVIGIPAKDLMSIEEHFPIQTTATYPFLHLLPYHHSVKQRKRQIEAS